MTKEELVELVDQAYATYRIEMPTKDDDIKALLNAWYELLHDLELTDVKRAFRNLAVVEEFLPRPGKLRKATIDAATKIPPFDDALVAWGKWLTVSQEAHSGMAPSIEVAAPLGITVERLGHTAFNMHTNSDREAFCSMYEKVLAELERDRYAVPDPPSKKIAQQ